MEQTKTQSLDQFIENHGITAEAQWTESNPNMADARPDAHHYRVTLHCEDRSMEVPFTMGSALTEEPTAAEVLGCMASDLISVRNEADWLKWAQEMGYESILDADQARNTYDLILAQGHSLKQLLGANALETLLWNTERL